MTLKFKTNINCNNCVKAIRPFIDEITQIEEWSVDTDNPDKIMTVAVESNLEERIIDSVTEAGFQIESLN